MALAHGTFGWVDLAAGDQEAATAFYTRLLDLESEDLPVDGGGHYTMLRKHGQNVAGIGGNPDPDSFPTTWQSYIIVDNADAVTARVPDLGGTLLIPAFDVMTSGRMAVVQDPTGAVVSLWQPRDHEGADVFNEHGAYMWSELLTRDIPAAKSFYQGLVGWRWSEMPLPDLTYHVNHVEGSPDDDPGNGGAMDITGMMPAEVPPHWAVYFHVDDVDATASEASELGGAVHVEPFDMAVGRSALIADPIGGMFYALTPSS